MKPIKLWLATMATLWCSLTASAYDFEVNGIYYNLVSASDLTVEVTSGDNYYSGDVIIPSTINYSGKTMTVTGIGHDTFWGCSGLTSISIPSTITNIATSAFSYCEGTIDIVVESDNTVYDSRNNCNAIIETSSNTLIAGFYNTTIPNSITSIGNNAFEGCYGLTSITIPNSVISIGNNAFWGCSGLTSITIGNSVTNIGYRAFDGCNAIEKLELNCPTIESWFYGKPFVKEVIIGNSVTSIGNSAFAYCSRLTSVTVGDSVTSIGNSAFTNSI